MVIASDGGSRHPLVRQQVTVSVGSYRTSVNVHDTPAACVISNSFPEHDDTLCVPS